MKKLYSVCFEFEVPVAADSHEQAKKIAEQQYLMILEDLNFKEFDIYALELEECPEDYIGCLPYTANDDLEDKVCQDYFESEPEEDEESKKHIQNTFLE